MALLPPYLTLDRLLNDLARGTARILVVAAAAFPLSAVASASCEDWHVEFLSVEGSVQIQRAGTTIWQTANLGDRVCTGDTVRVPAYGRASVRLPDTSKITLKHNSSVTFESGGEVTGWLLRLLRGALHVISRDPRELRFSTPYANAGLEGTEFTIEVSDDRTSVAVVEGEVVVTSDSGRVNVLPGELSATRVEGIMPTERVPLTLDYSRWAAYYPAILDGELPGAEEAPSAADPSDSAFFSARAARRLSLGRIDTAREDLEQALRLTPNDPSSLAVLAVLELGQGSVDLAHSHVRTALAQAPDAAAPLIALGHVLKATGDLAGARTALRRATASAPLNPLAWSNLAELELANGNSDAATQAAAHALGLEPDLAHAHAVLGFTWLAQLDDARAMASFEAAVERDPEWPLPRLGLGLALIKRGDVNAGREQLERAVIIDPTNAAVRSYMAKAYELENRATLARTQLDVAKQIDSRDPTPWLYASVYDVGSNRPVAALGELEKAMQLNERRTISRSRLAVDEDLAARTAGFASIYHELGFDELALVGGAKALARDPTDYSALRLLSSLYGQRSRRDIARANAAFQASLLQPLNVTPLPPRLGEANLFILDEAGPSDYTVGEFGSLLVKDGAKVRASAVAGERGTTGTEVVVAGLHDRFSYNIAHLGFESDGFRVNNDIDQEVTTAFLQYRATYSTSFQAELRSTETNTGDLTTLFDPSRFQANLRQNEQVDTLRLGMRHDISERGTLLASLIAQDIESLASNPPVARLSTNADGLSADVQYLWRGDRWTLTSGLTHLALDRFDDHSLLVPDSVPPTTVEMSDRFDQKQTVAYGYAHLFATDRLTLTVGASADSVKSYALSEDRLNPKLGVIWEAGDRTTVRASFFGTLQGALSSAKQNIQPRLEPFQVAGFTQFFFDREGDHADFRGVAIEHRISDDIFLGSEVSRRNLDAVGPGATDSVIRVREDLARAYAYWKLSAGVGLSAEIQRERITDPGQSFFGMVDVRTTRLPLEARYFHRSGFRAAVRASHIDQNGLFSDEQLGAGETLEYREDQFWVFDASLGYRLPNRRGTLSLHVDNLLDEQFMFQDADALNPSIAPERMAYFRFTLAFE